SGKSNLIRFLRFIHDTLGSDNSAEGLAFSKNSKPQGSHSYLNLKALSQNDWDISLSLLFYISEGSHTEFKATIYHLPHGNLLLNRESLKLIPNNSNDSPLTCYATEKKEGVLEGIVSVYTDMNKRDVRTEIVSELPSNQSVFHSLQTALERTSLPPRDIPYHEERRRIMGFMDKWIFYNASDMPSSGIKAATPKLGMRDDTLSESGDNLILVLYNLVKEFVDFEDELREAMTQLFPRTRKLRAIENSRTSITLEWYVADNSQPFYLDEMSDGTIRMLCWAAILLSPKPATLIVLDEPEMGIHPKWLRILAGWITRASRKTQVILSTHSADLLDYFTEERESVYVFNTDPDNLTSNLVKPLKEEWLKPKLEEGWQLGDLYRVGDPSIGGCLRWRRTN
ncbi:MAG: AAA family ATPase, partial [Armatimonadetes bacterium]|nr:AAA family ATPase [Armatimonadota bacterium]